WKRAVFEDQGRARSLQQGFCDEEAETQAARLDIRVVSAAPPAGHIRLPDPRHDFRREARPVVADGDVDGRAAPERADVDTLAREIDRVFQQIAEAVEDRRIARADRLGI